MKTKKEILNRLFKPEAKLVMGIVNLTPDSFYAGSRFAEEKTILSRVEAMLEGGADIIDLGAFSSRPGADFVSYETERERLMSPLKSIVKHFPETVLSVDTYRHKIAMESVAEGASIINDIAAGNLDEKMFETIAKLQVPYIMMHMQGTPINMQINPIYKDLIGEIKSFFSTRIKALKELKFDKIIIDPGFGFGKTLSHNYQLLNNLDEFIELGFPVLVGMSRKSMLYKYLDSSPDQMLNATSIVNTIALMKSANILRVHDVKPAIEVVKIVNKLVASS